MRVCRTFAIQSEEKTIPERDTSMNVSGSCLAGTRRSGASFVLLLPIATITETVGSVSSQTMSSASVTSAEARRWGIPASAPASARVTSTEPGPSPRRG